MADYSIHITAKHKWWDLHLKEVWQYRDLIGLFTKRTFAMTYKQTILGPAWFFLNPLFNAIVQAFVFGGIAGIRTDGIPTLLFYLFGNAVWTFFSGCLRRNADTFTANSGVFGKVYFPRLTIPISNVLSCAINFAFQMTLVLALLVYYLICGQVHPHWGFWLMLPVEVLHLGILGMGCGVIVSSLTTKYRDLSILVEFGTSLWMYLTPVVYPLSVADQGWMRSALLFNPVTSTMELLRYAILGQGTLHWGFYGLSWAVTIGVFLLGVMIFNRVERTFMDTV